jgi:predicted GTPase
VGRRRRQGARWDELETQVADRFPTLARLPSIAISALDGTRLGRLPALWQGLHEENTRRVPTASSTSGSRACRTRRRRRDDASAVPRASTTTQVTQAPPRFAIFASQPEAINPSYHGSCSTGCATSSATRAPPSADVRKST